MPHGPEVRRYTDDPMRHKDDPRRQREGDLGLFYIPGDPPLRGSFSPYDTAAGERWRQANRYEREQAAKEARWAADLEREREQERQDEKSREAWERGRRDNVFNAIYRPKPGPVIREGIIIKEALPAEEDRLPYPGVRTLRAIRQDERDEAKLTDMQKLALLFGGGPSHPGPGEPNPRGFREF